MFFHCLWNDTVTREIHSLYIPAWKMSLRISLLRVFPILWTFGDRDGLFNKTKIICSTKCAILGHSHLVSSRSRTGLSKKNARLDGLHRHHQGLQAFHIKCVYVRLLGWSNVVDIWGGRIIVFIVILARFTLVLAFYKFMIDVSVIFLFWIKTEY